MKKAELAEGCCRYMICKPGIIFPGSQAGGYFFQGRPFFRRFNGLPMIFAE
jgi:hypothetical protein